MTSVSDFSTRDRLAAVSLPLLSVGAALSRGFSFSSELRSSVFVFYSVIRQQVPKPRFVSADESALAPYTYNGDRLVLLA